MIKWCISPSLQKKKNKKFFASPTWSCEQIALSRQRRDGTINIVAMVMINYKLVPRDDGLFKRNYFEQKNDQEFSLFLAPHPEEAQLISLDGRRRKGRKPSQGCPGFCRRAENYEKRPKLRPTMNINPRLIQLLCQSQLYNLKKMRRRRKMWYDDQNKATRSEARVWELCVDLAFSLTWCRLSGLVRSKPPPPSFSDLTNRHQPSNTYFRRKVEKTSNGHSFRFVWLKHLDTNQV